MDDDNGNSANDKTDIDVNDCGDVCDIDIKAMGDVNVGLCDDKARSCQDVAKQQ